jgi:hypothetical protein
MNNEIVRRLEPVFETHHVTFQGAEGRKEATSISVFLQRKEKH